MSKITHFLAWGGAALVAGAIHFAGSPAGVALVHQYPVIGPIVGIIATLGAVYYKPTQGAGK